MSVDLVFLPATAPGDRTYGTIPDRLAAYPKVRVHAVEFPGVVWYNRAIRDQAIVQIRALGLDSFLLVGFSKSGLGAWNIAREMPDQVSGTLIFDAPVASDDWRRWGDDYYQDDVSWQRDLPLRIVRQAREPLPPTPGLVLISGASFHDQMCILAAALTAAGVRHTFIPHPEMRHHWNAGWIEEGLAVLLGLQGSS
jgi:pimeloyl-ACP methyl ester carboxylesterase